MSNINLTEASSGAVSPLIKIFGGKNKFLFFAIIITLLLGYLIYDTVVYRTEISEFTLKASALDSAGIAPNSHFLLNTTAPLTTQVLEKYIKFLPEIDFSIKKVSASEGVNQFEIIPDKDLNPDQIYTIKVDKGPLALRDYSWAYQVKAPFQIVSSIPVDKAIQVPANSGIELTFNRENLVNVDKYFEITPKVKGKIEVSGNVLKFIPDIPLQSSSVYTVKIRAGLKAKDTSDTIENDQVLRFETSSANTAQEKGMYFGRQFYEFKPQEEVYFGVYAYNISKVSSKVYKFDSAQKFVESMKGSEDTYWTVYYENIDEQIKGANKVLEGDLVVENGGASGKIRLPQKFDTGFYAMVTDSGNRKNIVWFQVNPVASFSAFSNSESLIWIKDIANDINISGADVYSNNNKISTTNTEGVAVFNTPIEFINKSSDTAYSHGYSRERNYLIVKIPTGDIVIPAESEYGYVANINKADMWWDYISLNKNIFLPSDTIRFWALVKSRDESGIVGTDKRINVKLTNSYWSESQKITTYAESNLDLSEYNTVTGELAFSNLKPGIYYLTFRNGEKIISQQTISVSTYIKPAYKITATPDKYALFAGDTVTYKVKAEFFDGTPVSGAPMIYSAYGGLANIKGSFKLDKDGEGSFSITPEYKDTTYWPSYLSINIHPKDSEEGQIETDATLFVFGPHLNSSITEKKTGNNTEFTIKTREVKIKDTQSVAPYWDTESYLGGPTADVLTKIDIFETKYIQEQSGTGYDQINKISYPIYNYRNEEIPMGSESVYSDANGIAKFVFTTDQNKTYKFIFSSTDHTGRLVKSDRYIYGGNSVIGTNQNDLPVYLSNADGDNKKYKIGENYNLQLKNSIGVVPNNSTGDYLFMIINNGKIEYQIQDSPKFSRTFQAKDIPNITVSSGRFVDGEFQNTYQQNISFDENSRRLNISVKKVKASNRVEAKIVSSFLRPATYA